MDIIEQDDGKLLSGKLKDGIDKYLDGGDENRRELVNSLDAADRMKFLELQMRFL